MTSIMLGFHKCSNVILFNVLWRHAYQYKSLKDGNLLFRISINCLGIIFDPLFGYYYYYFIIIFVSISFTAQLSVLVVQKMLRLTKNQITVRFFFLPEPCTCRSIGNQYHANTPCVFTHWVSDKNSSIL